MLDLCQRAVDKSVLLVNIVRQSDAHALDNNRISCQLRISSNSVAVPSLNPLIIPELEHAACVVNDPGPMVGESEEGKWHIIGLLDVHGCLHCVHHVPRLLAVLSLCQSATCEEILQACPWWLLIADFRQEVQESWVGASCEWMLRQIDMPEGTCCQHGVDCLLQLRDTERGLELLENANKQHERVSNRWYAVAPCCQSEAKVRTRLTSTYAYPGNTDLEQNADVQNFQEQ